MEAGANVLGDSPACGGGHTGAASGEVNQPHRSA